MPILDFNDPNPAFGGGGADVAETFASDTSGGPVTVTLPDLSDLDNGYIVRVYDAASNASTYNITINDSDDVEVDVIDEDDGERYLVVVGGAWEVRGYLPQATTPPTVADVAILAGAKHVWGCNPDDPLEDAAGSADLAYLEGSQVPGQATLVPGISGVVRSSGEVYRRLAAATGATAVTFHRGAERSFNYLLKAYSVDVGNTPVFMSIGDYGGTTGLCFVRAPAGDATWLVANQGWGVDVGIGAGTDLRDRWVMITGHWVPGDGKLYLYVRPDDAAEATYELTPGGTITEAGCRVSLGYHHSNTYTCVTDHALLALYDGDAAVAARLDMYAALGW